MHMTTQRKTPIETVSKQPISRMVKNRLPNSSKTITEPSYGNVNTTSLESKTQEVVTPDVVVVKQTPIQQVADDIQSSKQSNTKSEWDKPPGCIASDEQNLLVSTRERKVHIIDQWEGPIEITEENKHIAGMRILKYRTRCVCKYNKLTGACFCCQGKKEKIRRSQDTENILHQMINKKYREGVPQDIWHKKPTTAFPKGKIMFGKRKIRDHAEVIAERFARKCNINATSPVVEDEVKEKPHFKKKKKKMATPVVQSSRKHKKHGKHVSLEVRVDMRKHKEQLERTVHNTTVERRRRENNVAKSKEVERLISEAHVARAKKYAERDAKNQRLASESVQGSRQKHADMKYEVQAADCNNWASDIPLILSRLQNLHGDKVTYFVERIVETIVLMSKAPSWAYALWILKIFICEIVGYNVSSTVSTVLQDIWKIDEWDTTRYGYVVQAAEDDVMGLFLSWLSSGGELAESEFMVKIKRTISYVAALGLCKSMGTSFSMQAFETWVADSDLKKCSKLDILLTVLTTVRDFCQTGYAYFTGDDRGKDFFGRKTNKFYDDMALVLGGIVAFENSQIQLLTDNEGEFLTEEKYMIVLDRVTEQAKTMLMHVDDIEKRILRTKMEQLVRVKARVVAHRLHVCMRVAPYAYLLCGGTGVGKTNVSPMLIQAICRANGFCTDPSSIYAMNMQDKYDTNYNPWTVVVRVDDAGTIKAEHEEGCLPDKLIRLINNEAITALKADVDSKGKIWMQPKIVAITTNKWDLDLRIKMNEPVAGMRRMLSHITMTVRPEFQQKDTSMLDPSKMGEGINDAWLFTVRRAKPLHNSNVNAPTPYDMEVMSDDEGVLHDVGIHRLVKHIVAQSKEHFVHQKRVMETANMMHDVDLCKHNSFAQVCPQCNEPKNTTPDRVQGLLDLARLHLDRPEDCIPEFLLPYVDKIRRERKEIEDILRVSGVVTPPERKRGRPFSTQADNIWDDCSVSSYDSVFTLSETDAMMLAKLKAGHYWLASRLPEWLYSDPRFVRATDLVCTKKTIASVACGVVMICLLMYCAGIRYPLVAILSLCTLLTMVHTAYMARQLHTKLLASAAEADAILRVMEPAMKYRHMLAAGGSLVVVLSVVSTMLGFLTLMRKTNDIIQTVRAVPEPEVQGGKPSIPVDTIQKPKVWINPVVHRPKARERMQTCTRQHVVEGLKKRIASAHFMDSPMRGDQRTMIVPFKGNTWIAPLHVVNKGFTRVHVCRDAGKINSNRIAAIAPHMWVAIPDTDLALITLKELAEIMDYSDFYVDKHVDKEISAIWIHKDKETNTVDTMVRMCKERALVKDGHLTIAYDAWHYLLDRPTSKGMCMAPLVSCGVIPYILGFHLAGVNDQPESYGACITRGQLMHAYDTLFADARSSNVEVQSEGVMNLDNDEHGVKLLYQLHDKSPFKHLEEGGTAVLYGAHSGSRRHFSSNVCKTVFSDTIEKETGIACMHGPPMGMNSTYPWRADAINAIVMTTPEPNIMDRAYKDLYDHYQGIMVKHPEAKKYVNVLSLVEALSGLDGVRGVDAVPLSTSSGWPERKKKSDFITECDEEHDGITRPLQLGDVHTGRLNAMLAKWDKGERAYPINQMHLKDEPTKIGKTKVRVFAGCPLEFMLAVRIYCTGILKMMLEHKYEFETGVGINATSKEWQEAYDYVTSKGSNNYNGDFAFFDIKFGMEKILMVFKLFMVIAKWSGNYSDKDIRMLRGIASELSSPVCEYNGEFVEWMMRNLSGHGATVNVNGCGNSLDNRYGYYDIHQALQTDGSWIEGFREKYPEQSENMPEWIASARAMKVLPPFAEVVALITYGDDNQASVSPDVPWFNHTTLAYSLSRVGITYTMADKTSASVPYVPIEQCSFLKRTWRKDEELGTIVAPLEEASLFKTLHTHVQSKALTNEEQSVEGLKGVMREYFFHGREKYDDMSNKLGRVIATHHMWGYWPKRRMETYDEMKQRYIEDNEPKIPDSSGFVKNEHTVLDYGTTQRETSSVVVDACSLNRRSSMLGLVTVQSRDENNTVTEKIQSRYEIGSVAPNTSHQTLNFRDGTPQWNTGIPSGYEATRKQGMEMEPGLKDFFQRPVEYVLPDWVPGSATPYSVVVNPWDVFWSNKRVVNRIAGFKNLQCTMRFKININGNSFYYGRLMADYRPLHLSNTVDTTANLNKNAAIQASQRSHLYINPTNSTGGEMSLPFIWYYNSLDIVANDMAKMGIVNIREMVGLKHANASTTNVSLTMFIWAENVEMSGLTMANPVTIVAQAADEYASKPVSQIATAISDAAGKLSKAPVIGTYAKATQMAAGSVSALAKAFGYSRPPDVVDPITMRPKILSRFANTNVADSVTKLTADIKQELTIDPKVVGVDEEDGLSIRKIATTETFVFQFSWVVGAAVNARLYNAYVTPVFSVPDASFTPTMSWLPACTFAALPFRYWRGTIRYRFQVVCSEYHRGRLKFVYDSHAVLGAPEANMSMTRIVDLEKEREFTMDIGMAQPKSFLRVGDYGPASSNMSATAYTAAETSGFTNGMLAVFVATELTTPNNTVNNDIVINVFMNTCDDIDFAEPTDTIIQAMTYSTQAEDVGPDESAPVVEVADEKAMDCLDVDHTHDVHFGETFVSFRNLLKRYAYQGSWLCPTTGRSIWELTLHNYPYPRGRWTNAVNVDSTLAKSNLVPTTLFTYLYPTFVAMRGSVRWKYLYGSDRADVVAYATIVRRDGTSLAAYNNTTVPVVTSNNAYMVSKGTTTRTGTCGGDTTFVRAQPAMEFEVPYYSNARFVTAKDLASTNPELCPQSFFHSLTVDNANTAVSYVDRYVSTGEDFTLILFQGAPPVKSVSLAAT